MKRKLLVLMAVMMAAVSTAWADDVIENDVSIVIDATNNVSMIFNLNHTQKTAEVGSNASKTFSGTTFNIPEKVYYDYDNDGDDEEYTVESIAEGALHFYAFSNYPPTYFYNRTITTITIPKTVKTIGKNAFTNIEKLETINFDVVSGCNINREAFGKNGSSTTQLVLGGNVKEYPSYIVKTFDPTEITIPSQITKLGDYAFEGCSNLETVTFASDVNLKEIGKYAFSRCSSLERIKLPNSVTTLGESAFSSCSKLTSVVLPENLEKMRDGVFGFCSSLTELTIPSKVDSIGSSAFSSSTKLNTLYVLPLTAPTVASGGWTFSNASSNMVIYVRKAAMSSYKYTFSGWSNKNLMPLPNIKYYSNNSNKVVPNGTAVFGDNVSILENSLDGEEGSYHVGYIEFSGSPTTIPSGAFSGKTNLVGMEFPSTVGSIGENAFNGCSSLSSLLILYNSAPTVTSNPFTGTPDGMTLYVREVANGSFGSTWQGKTVVTLPNIRYTSDGGVVVTPKFTNFGTGVEYLGSFYDGNGCGYIEFKGNPTKIPSSAFQSNTALKTVVLPNGITEIESSAFQSNTKLDSIVLPSSITVIYSNGFSGCTKLTSINIPAQTTKLDSWAFNGCTALTSVTFDSQENLKEIQSEAFKNCSSLTSLVLPESITKIGSRAFESCTGFTEFTIPASVTDLGQYVFSGCTNLNSIYLLPTSTKDISSLAFNSTSAVIYARKSFIDTNFFGYHSVPNEVRQLTEIKYVSDDQKTVALNVATGYGTDVKYVGSYYDGGEEGNEYGNLLFTGVPTAFPANAFSGKSNLTWFDFPDEYTAIGDNAFAGTGLTEVFIPASITSIGENVFSGCANLKSIVLLSAEPSNISVSTSSFTNTSSSDMKVYVRFKAYDSYASATNWQGISFESLPYIKYTSDENVVVEPYVTTGFGENVKYLGSYNDGGVEGDRFGYIEFMGSPTKIPNEAFRTKSVMTSIEYPSTVTEIGEEAFQSCYGLTTYTIPAQITKLGRSAFGYCKNLNSVEFESGINLTEIVKQAFDHCEALTSITIPDGVTTIRDGAFFYCKALSSVEIPEGVETIGDQAFEYCDKITELTIPSTVTTIGRYAFSSCNALATLTLYAELESIGDYAFSGTKITTLNYNVENAETLTAKPYDASKLTTVNIGENVKSIPAGAFSGCSSLATINVCSDEPATLGIDAFDGISSGHEVNVPLNGYMAYKADEDWNAMNLQTSAGTLELSDTKPYTINFELDDCQLSYTRKVSNNNWMGVYLPFNVTVTSAGTFATLTGVTDEVLEWETVNEGTIDACTPFIYKPTAFNTGEENRDITFSASNATLYSCNEESNAVTIDGYTLDGTFTSKDDMEGVYALAGGVFRRGGENAMALSPYRIFLTIDPSKKSSGAPVRNRINGEEVTAIDDIEVDIDPDLDNARAYNLQGLRVGHDYKGIVIINGKKVLKK